MAWTDQCKIAFTTTADALYYQQQGRKNKTKIIKKLAIDTDISPRTLRRWWDAENKAKNGHVDVTDSDNKENQSQSIDNMCEKCHENPKKVVHKTSGQYFCKLCHKCQSEKEKQQQIQQLKMVSGQIKSIQGKIIKEGTDHKWNGRVRKEDYQTFINILIEAVKVWEEVSK